MLATALTIVTASAAGTSPRRCCPQDWVQLASGAAASYAAEHGGYEGLTPDALRSYDSRVQYVVVVRSDASTYCLESTIGDRSAFKNGPSAQVLLGMCAQPDAGTPVAVHTMEAFNADHASGYKGATVKKLQAYDHGVVGIKIVRATARTYCIESTVGPWSAFKNGPPAPIPARTCSRQRRQRM